MQIHLTALLAAAGLTSARGLPHADEMFAPDGGLIRRSTCDIQPAAENSTASALATNAATTAADCQVACGINSRCKSFVFGLTTSSSSSSSSSSTEDAATVCLLYSVPADDIPPTQDDVRAYDEDCTDVSDSAQQKRWAAAADARRRARRAREKAEAKRESRLKRGVRRAEERAKREAREAKEAAKKGATIESDMCGAAPKGRTASASSSSSSSGQQPLVGDGLLRVAEGVASAADCLGTCKRTAECKS